MYTESQICYGISLVCCKERIHDMSYFLQLDLSLPQKQQTLHTTTGAGGSKGTSGAPPRAVESKVGKVGAEGE